MNFTIDPRAKALIRVKVAKANLYEAKVSVLETQKKWDRRGGGESVFFQQRLYIY